MTHNHSFSRKPDRMHWDTEKEQMIVEADCSEHLIESSSPLALSQNPASMTAEKRCDTTRKTAYEIYSVVDYHNEHTGPTSFVLNDSPVTSSDSEHISNLETVPSWVEKVTEIASNIVSEQNPQTILAELVGQEIPLTIATSETEYNVIFSQVDQWIDS